MNEKKAVETEPTAPAAKPPRKKRKDSQFVAIAGVPLVVAAGSTIKSVRQQLEKEAKDGDFTIFSKRLVVTITSETKTVTTVKVVK